MPGLLSHRRLKRIAISEDLIKLRFRHGTDTARPVAPLPDTATLVHAALEGTGENRRVALYFQDESFPISQEGQRIPDHDVTCVAMTKQEDD